MKLTLIDNQTLLSFWQKDKSSFGTEFLISSEWQELQQQEGLIAELKGVYDEKNELVAVFCSLKKELGLSLFYYYLPRGPVFLEGLNLEKKLAIINFLEAEFKQKGAVFLRIEPREKELIKNLKTSINLQPQKTLMLDLSLSLNDLLNIFHHKTRYNIKLAEKKGVKVTAENTTAAFHSFWSLMTETGKRDAFKIHNYNHYQLLATFNPKFIKLFTAEFEGKIIAAGLFSFYGNKVTYLHGASDYKQRQLMAPYLLQWTLIKLAKESGYRYYDFYGIDEQKWPGVTRFKKGFGGFEVTYAGTFDLILNQFKYLIYKFLRVLRRLF